MNRTATLENAARPWLRLAYRARVVLCCTAIALSLGFPCFADRFFVDCEKGDDGAIGTVEKAAWRSLDRVNSASCGPGDEILLRRGTRCAGTFQPDGSGVSGAPLTLGAYDTGPPPIIDAGSNEAAIKLVNQEYWHIRNIETTGGSPFGIHVTGDIDGTLNHFRIIDTVVHDVAGLRVQVVDVSPEGMVPDVAYLRNVMYDWNLTAVDLFVDTDRQAASLFGVDQLPTTFLISPDSLVINRWEGFTPAHELASALEAVLKTPEGTARGRTFR